MGVWLVSGFVADRLRGATVLPWPEPWAVSMANPSSVYDQLKHKLKLRLAEVLTRGAGKGHQATIDRQAIADQLHHLLNLNFYNPNLLQIFHILQRC